jgi:predicted AlkP superfamily phosphohydrolase/phosphomutase
MPSNTTAIVVSNMGLQEDYPNFRLTTAFCRQLGYHRMKPSADSQSRLQRLARRAIPSGLQAAISRRLPSGFRARMLSREWLGGTDWSMTTVFPIPSYFLGFLRVNLRGREPQGIVEPGRPLYDLLDRVESDLRCLIDPVSGGPAIRHVFRSVDRFGVEASDLLPDIFFDWAPLPYVKQRVNHPRAVLEQKDMFFNRDTRHDLTGLFAAAGPGIAIGRDLGHLSVLDVAPTCLHLMGQSIPSSMRGAVAARAFV